MTIESDQFTEKAVKIEQTIEESIIGPVMEKLSIILIYIE